MSLQIRDLGSGPIRDNEACFKQQLLATAEPEDLHGVSDADLPARQEPIGKQESLIQKV